MSSSCRLPWTSSVWDLLAPSVTRLFSLDGACLPTPTVEASSNDRWEDSDDNLVRTVVVVGGTGSAATVPDVFIVNLYCPDFSTNAIGRSLPKTPYCHVWLLWNKRPIADNTTNPWTIGRYRGRY